MVDFSILGCGIYIMNWKDLEKQHKCIWTASDSGSYPCVSLNTLWHNSWMLVGLPRSLTHGGLWSCISTSLWACCHLKHPGLIHVLDSEFTETIDGYAVPHTACNTRVLPPAVAQRDQRYQWWMYSGTLVPASCFPFLLLCSHRHNQASRWLMCATKLYAPTHSLFPLCFPESFCIFSDIVVLLSLAFQYSRLQ